VCCRCITVAWGFPPRGGILRACHSEGVFRESLLWVDLCVQWGCNEGAMRVQWGCNEGLGQWGRCALWERSVKIRRVCDKKMCQTRSVCKEECFQGGKCAMSYSMCAKREYPITDVCHKGVYNKGRISIEKCNEYFWQCGVSAVKWLCTVDWGVLYNKWVWTSR
jgi:hypothetical protein